MWKQILVFFICFLLACTTTNSNQTKYTSHAPVVSLSETFNVYIDKSFSVKQKEDVIQAIEDWNLSFNGNLKINIASTSFDMDFTILDEAMNDPNTWLIFKIDSSNQMLDAFNTNVLAFTSHSMTYLIVDRIPSIGIRQAAMHEIGHLVLGSIHTDRWLMQPKFDLYQYDCVDYDTAILIADKYHVDLQTLNWCSK